MSLYYSFYILFFCSHVKIQVVLWKFCHKKWKRGMGMAQNGFTYINIQWKQKCKSLSNVCHMVDEKMCNWFHRMHIRECSNTKSIDNSLFV